jgi:hypothetical protein
MANRTFNSGRTLDKELVDLAVLVNLDSSGNVVAGSLVGRGVTSITRISAGLYKVLLQDSYVALHDVSGDLSAGNAATQPIWVQPGDFNISGASSTAAVAGVSSASSISAQTVYVRTINASGVAADTTVAGTLFVSLTLRNSTVV